MYMKFLSQINHERVFIDEFNNENMFKSLLISFYSICIKVN